MTPAPRRRARLRLTILAVLAALLATLSATGGASAQEPLTREELGLTVRTGYAEGVSVTGWTPVEVRFAPTRLFAGTLSVLTRTDVAEIVEDRAIEAAAGAEKVYRFLVPPTSRVQVRVAESGREPLVDRPRGVDGPTTSFLIGVLQPALPAGLPPAAATGSDARGTFAAVDPAWLDVSPLALDTISTLVVRATDLAELGETAAARIRTAVTDGLELVIVADTAGSLDLAAAGLPWSPATGASATTVTLGEQGAAQPVLGLEAAPDAWTLVGHDVEPGAGDAVLVAAVNAGRGRVSVSGVGLGGSGLGGDARLWGHLLQPGSRTVRTFDQHAALGRPVSLVTESLRSQGLSLPSLPWLTVFLVAFVLLVGPLNGFVLRRIGRPELAWLTIPAITLVFATGAYAGASGAQPPVGLAATASWWIDGQGQQLAVTAVRSPREGVQTVRFPGDDWAVLPANHTATPSQVERDGGDSTVTFDLGALQVGTALGWRATSEPAPLEVTARADGAQLLVTVTNRTAGTARDVAVHAGTLTRPLGDLAPGGTKELELDIDQPLPVLEAWRDDFEGLRDFEDGRVTPPRSLEAVLRWSVLDGSPGLVWAVGDLASSPSGLPAADGGAQDLGGLVAVGVTPDASGADELGPTLVSRTPLLNGGANQGMHRPTPTSLEGQGEVVLRYRLPGGSDVATLVSSLERGVNDGEFLPGPPGDAVRVVPACPPGASRCEQDGDLFEVCHEIPGPEGETGGEECTITVIAPDAPVAPGRLPQGLEMELFDHTTGTFVFARDAVVRSGDRETLDADRFLGPLGDVYVRVRGGMFPFDFSGRGLGATIGGGA